MGDNKDVLITSIVDTVNNSALEMGVSLNVNGAVITGILVSYPSYLKGLSEFLKGHNVVAESLSRVFDVAASAQQELIETDDEKTLPDMIHLKDAKLINGNNTINLNYWRGKLTSVDGFTIGSLETV